MKVVAICVENALYEFYQKVGQQAGGLPPEQVMADALFKLAGELSLHALRDTKGKKSRISGGITQVRTRICVIFFTIATR